ncbi:hypothetical protein GIB67_027407 [Kingdonia uniflora]|uniref:Tetratricopeptide repeat-like superfamily protein n=1 Tax=Kingdonia uniflora TaxID=39325 RepID=A0A7J7MFH3_9MAGN|nr:hypothetical protein GIB67_027407 [Kingdonia uniflora]
MGVKIAGSSLNWSQSVVSQCPSPSSSCHTLASAMTSPSSRRARNSHSLVCRFVHPSDRSALFGSSKLVRSRSFDKPKAKGEILKRAISAGFESFDGFSDEEFAEQIQELALRFHFSNDEGGENSSSTLHAEEINTFVESRNTQGESSNISFPNFNRVESMEPPWVRIRSEPSNWHETDEIIPSSIERKANSVDLPLSLRIIQKKTQWQKGIVEQGEAAYSSVKKAFSSLVFIIREIQSYTLQMREALYYEDLQGILARVQQEMNASFVWLFQQIFSHTPTLMVYVMILLANFTVYSMANNVANAAPTPSITVTTEVTLSITQDQIKPKKFIDSSAIRTFSIGGNSGGGGKVRPLASGTDGGEGRFDAFLDHHHRIVPDEVSQVSSFGNTTPSKEIESESSRQNVISEDERKLWNLIVDEALRMQAVFMDESLDHETMQQFVSPVTVEVEPEHYETYFRTELLYQQALIQDPKNALLLSNYAQFLYLVAHDHNRADEYFKRSIEVKPKDPDALSRYANYLWVARKDIEAAEETYLEAIEADPGNMFHAGNYAHFLWNTGGDDTCYPLSSPGEA